MYRSHIGTGYGSGSWHVHVRIGNFAGLVNLVEHSNIYWISHSIHPICLAPMLVGAWTSPPHDQYHDKIVAFKVSSKSHVSTVSLYPYPFLLYNMCSKNPDRTSIQVCFQSVQGIILYSCSSQALVVYLWSADGCFMGALSISFMLA